MRPAPALWVAASLVLAGCVSGGGYGHRSVQECSDRVGFNQRAAAARASGVTGNIHATPEELAAIKACVGDGPSATAISTPAPVPVRAQAPAPVAAAPVAARGNLPLPVQYPLLPGDAELWPTLTVAEQQRALLYLKDGSTIRSSLGAN
ncbi:hypothetical protein [Defluviimonas sp. SAOS-178_SWC]|uniref:hypothetical protein n=1 Tax=Defluviimonas sp. SAOS-178_SWC TaxID=3121287 RepID=UPI00322202FC